MKRNYIKSYTLTPEVQKKVDEILAEYKEKYSKYDGIMCHQELSPEYLKQFEDELEGDS